jgi:predicted MFS family arabinose efflux permease
MASKAERTIINAAALVQGIVLVTFPAASTIFTDKSEYGLSSTQYGAMFLPQVALAIAASLLGAGLARRITAKRVYLLGLACSTISMVLLLASTLVKSNQAAAYPMLLVATAFLGAGFGLTVPVLNTYTSVFNPDRVDRSVLTLNALLGLGTALAPVLVALFVGLGFWWGLPVLSTVLLAGLLLVSLRLPLRAGAQAAASRQGGQARPRLPVRFWLYAAFAVCYGVCETMNGNWSQLDMTTRLGASATQASLALAAFWAMVTVGRVLFAAIGRWLPERVTYCILPFVLVGTFLLTSVLSRPHAAAGIAVFALAGLGCSALLPLTISFGERDLTTMAAAMAGGVIAFYQLGYGIAAFGVGPLQDAGVSLSRIFGFTAIIAAVMALLSLFVTRRPAPAGRAAGPDAALPVRTSRLLASDRGDLQSESSPEG